LDTIEVVRADVIAKLKENREQHKATYEEADANYRQVCVDALRARANDIEGGGRIQLIFELPKPEDHTEDYDNAIAMLEWDQREKIELDQMDFRAYVLDKWHWERSFAANTMSYSAGARR
jgi:hypothetical protein